MNDYNKNEDDVQTVFDFDNFPDEHDLIPVEPQVTLPVPISKKNFSHPVLTFDNPSDEDNFSGKDIIPPDTLFSPKDKVSNHTWDNKLPIGRHRGVITVRKAENFGCVVQLDYEKIINSNDVVTGAELSKFDRCVYDAVVTLFVSGYDTFSTADILRIVSHNPKAKLTPVNRDKIIKSMFHISRFWLSILTDDSERFDVWCSLSRNTTFNSERKYYKNLQATYTCRLLDFRVIGNITFDVTYLNDEQEVTKKESFPEVWKILAPPILYQYAKAKGQISSVPMKFLDTSSDKSSTVTAVRRGACTNELASFLAREIDTMKKTAKHKQPYSHVILLDRIYKIDGIDDVQKDINSLNKKKSRTRDKLVKILQHFKENGLINGHTFHKKVHGKALTFHSVEVLLPK